MKPEQMESRCPHCGGTGSAEARFCPACGRDTTAPRRPGWARRWVRAGGICLLLALGLAVGSQHVVPVDGSPGTGLVPAITALGTAAAVLLVWPPAAWLVRRASDWWFGWGANPLPAGAETRQPPGACANCDQELPSSACFCPTCGLALPGAPPGERRRLVQFGGVALVFGGIAGSVGLCAGPGEGPLAVFFGLLLLFGGFCGAMLGAVALLLALLTPRERR